MNNHFISVGRFLLLKGADIKHKDKNGDNALMKATRAKPRSWPAGYKSDMEKFLEKKTTELWVAEQAKERQRLLKAEEK